MKCVCCVIFLKCEKWIEDAGEITIEREYEPFSTTNKIEIIHYLLYIHSNLKCIFDQCEQFDEKIKFNTHPKLIGYFDDLININDHKYDEITMGDFNCFCFGFVCVCVCVCV